MAGGADEVVDSRHRSAVTAAWASLASGQKVLATVELSAMVSTNRVYRLALDDGSRVVAKSSDFGSFFLFAEDHDRLHRCSHLLQGGRYERFMAKAVVVDDRPFIWYDGEIWVVFYEDVDVKGTLPAILSEKQVDCLGRELADFHRACSGIAGLVPPPSKTAKSDAVNFYEALGSRGAGEQFALDRSRLDLVKRHTHTFLTAMHEQGYDYWPKIPVLIDWNLGNFSVEFEGTDMLDFKLYSRWDYDWFRIESRLLDFYFMSRVSSRTGDREHFTYGAHTLLEPRFRQFLRSYHSVFPLTDGEVMFLKEAYRFFLLHYVVHEGQHFFRHEIWSKLLHDVVDLHLPQIDELDLSPLLDELG